MENKKKQHIMHRIKEHKILKSSKLAENIGLKLAALLFAALLWLIVVNVDDPIDSATFRNIPVTVTNEEVVTNMGKVYQIVDGTDSVTVTVSAPRSVLAKISSEDIIATANLSYMDVNTYLVPIDISVRGHETTEVSATANPNNLLVNIEDITRNSFPISISASGTARYGYVVGEMKVNPETITVRGSESMIESISRVVARVDVSGLSQDSVLEAQLVYYDGNGNVMDATQFNNNLGEEGITVEVQMLRIKEVGVEVAVTGTPEEGYLFTGWSSEPQTIQICGTEEALEQVDKIAIWGEGLDVSGLSESAEVTVDVSEYLPEGIQLVDESVNNIMVTMNIEQEGTRTIELPIEAIRIDNMAEKLSISFESVTEVSFAFTGVGEVLNNLDIRNAAFIDLKNYDKPGTYEVPVQVEEIEKVTLTEKPVVKIILKEREKKETKDEKDTKNTE